MIITIQDARNAGYCVAGIRNRFKEYGLDFRQFVKYGITEADLRATGDDAIADKLIMSKIENNHGQQ